MSEKTQETEKEIGLGFVIPKEVIQINNYDWKEITDYIKKINDNLGKSGSGWKLKPDPILFDEDLNESKVQDKLISEYLNKTGAMNGAQPEVLCVFVCGDQANNFILNKLKERKKPEATIQVPHLALLSSGKLPGFSPEYEHFCRLFRFHYPSTLELFYWHRFFSLIDGLASNDTGKVVFIHSAKEFPTQECDAFAKRFRDKYELFPPESFKSHDLDEFVKDNKNIKDILDNPPDIIYVSGLNDDKCAELIIQLAQGGFEGTVCSNMTIKNGELEKKIEELEKKNEGLSEFPFQGEGVYYLDLLNRESTSSFLYQAIRLVAHILGRIPTNEGSVLGHAKLSDSLKTRIEQMRYYPTKSLGVIAFTPEKALSVPLKLNYISLKEKKGRESKTSIEEPQIRDIYSVGQYLQEFSKLLKNITVPNPQVKLNPMRFDPVGNEANSKALVDVANKIQSEFSCKNVSLFLAGKEDNNLLAPLFKGEQNPSPVIKESESEHAKSIWALLSTLSTSLKQEKVDDLPIQINLREDDYPDNDAYRLYLQVQPEKELATRRANNKLPKNAYKHNWYGKQWILPLQWFLFYEGDAECVTSICLQKYENATKEERFIIWEKNGEQVIEREHLERFFDLLRLFFHENNETPSDTEVVQYIYIFPDSNNTIDLTGGIILASVEKLPFFDLQTLMTSARQLFVPYRSEINRAKMQLAHMQSAIGSIMSRNGSHNIGSHVLSALSHSIGVRPDDRVLYKYIQHRMDYIATVTADFPTWSASTWFLRDMMRRFYKQKHLLEYIAASESLAAYHFQNATGKPIENPGDAAGKIILRVLGNTIYDDRSEKYKRIIISDHHDKEEETFDDDFLVAIPGGVVGQQAFYTILENIIRNSAKHSWSDSDLRKGEKNLEITIEFTNKIQDDHVKFVIWDNLSDALRPEDYSNYKPRTMWEKLTDDEEKEIYKGEEKDRSTQECAHKKLNRLLRQPLINDDGELRREAWGLAEMRISTGFLKRKKVDEIGRGGEENVSLKAIPHPNAEYCRTAHHTEPNAITHNLGRKDGAECKHLGTKCVACNAIYHIGYEFQLPKPKEMLVCGLLDKTVTSEWKVQGVTIKRLDNKESIKYEFSYVIFDGQAFDLCWDKWQSKHKDVTEPAFNFVSQFPFRLIVFGESTFIDDYLVSKNSGLHWKRICYIREKEVIDSINQAGSEEKPLEFKAIIYKQWLKHLSRRNKRDGGQSEFPLSIDTQTIKKGSGGNGGLITGAKIAEHVARQLLPGMWQKLGTPGNGKEVVDAIRNGYEKPLSPDIIQGLCKKYNWNEDYYENSCSDFIYEWLEKKGCRDPLLSLFVGNKSKHLKQALDNKESEETQELNKLLEDIIQKYTDRNKALGDVEEFILKFNLVHTFKTAFETAKSMLQENDEHIETIPISYVGRGPRGNKVDSEKSCACRDYSKKMGIALSIGSKNRNGLDDSGKLISYQRHKPIEKGFITIDPKEGDSVLWGENKGKVSKTTGEHFQYIEALSGTQSYLSILEAIKEDNLSNEDISVLCGLVENALLRYLIVDERMLEFINEHVAAVDIFRGICIDVAGKLKNFQNQGGRTFDVKQNMGIGETVDFKSLRDCEKAQYDVLLIHQGVIDKLVCLNNKKSVGEFLVSLSEVFPYVVITTGRGVPSDVPNFVKILAFSNVESYLFARYPQKLLISGMLMSMLPNKY